MHRFAWFVIACVACGGEKDKGKVTPPPATPDSAVATPEPPKPDARTERPADDKAPPPITKPVEGDCGRKNEDVALVAVCDYRCTALSEAEACAIGAKKYYAGDGIRIDQAKGAALVKRACELESSDGCTYLARLEPAKGDDLTAKATTYLERDCAADKAMACLELSDRVKAFDDARSKTELEHGFDLAVKGCDAGEGYLCLAVANLLASGGNGIEKDVMKVPDLRKRACDGGHAVTCMALASETDKEDKRIALIDKACTLGHRKACHALAREVSITSKSPTKAAKAQERACVLGDGESCVVLGEEAAKRGERDKAIELLAKACKSGNDTGCSQAKQLGAK